jgi:PAS domain S-box-containing protein
MKKLKFQTRINLAFFLLFFTLLFGGYLLFRMNNLNQNMELFYNHPFAVTNSAGAFKSEISNINHWLDHFVNSLGENDKVIYNEIKKRDSIGFTELKTIQTLYLGKKSELDSLNQSYHDYSRFVNQVIQLRKNEDITSAKVLLEKFGLVKLQQVESHLDVILNFSKNKANELYKDTLVNSKKRIKYFWIGFCFLAIINLILSFYISRSITKPIKNFIFNLNSIYKKNEDLTSINKLSESEEETLDNTILEIKNSYDKLREFNTELEGKVLKTSDELQLSEHKFKMLFEKSADALLILENGLFVDCNQATIQMLNYTSKDEFLNVHPYILSPKMQPKEKDSYQEAQKNIEKALNDGSHRFEWIHKKATGELFPVEVLLTTIVNEPNKQIIYCVWRDITHRVETNLKLQSAKHEAEQNWDFLENIVNNIGDPVFVKDKESNYLIVNDAFCSMFKLSRKELLTKSEIKNIKTEENETYWRIDKQVLETGEESINEETMTLKGKAPLTIFTRKTRYIDKAGNKFIVGIIRDFTDRIKVESEIKSAKQRAEQSEEFLNNIINKIIDPVFVKDSESRMLIVNNAFCKLFDMQEEDILGKTLYDNVSTNEMNASLSIDKEVINTGKDSIIEETITIRGGETKNILTQKSRFIDEHGKIFLVGIITDISNLKKTEIELILAKEKAEESERLKSAFLANMSHEIRTPMNAILGFTSLLNDNKLDSVKRQKFMHLIDDAGKRLLSIISDIVDVSKINANQLSINYNTHNLNEIIDNLHLQFSLQIPSNQLELVTKKTLDDVNSFINTDRTRLMQVFSNLLENAIKYTEKGSITFGYEVTSKGIKFYVIDTGIGIDENGKKLIFERFSQINNNNLNAVKGIGLGLAIAKGIVELFGGTIWAESNQKQGTTINFEIPYLPVIPTEEEKNIFEPITSNLIPHKTKVLVVEDEFTNFVYIREVLKSFNLEIIHAENGKMAVELFEQHQDIDLVLMDIKMPIMDGYESTFKIRLISSTVPIIAITAYALAEDETRALKAGCNEYVAKPTSKKMLYEIIHKYLKVNDIK